VELKKLVTWGIRKKCSISKIELFLMILLKNVIVDGVYENTSIYLYFENTIPCNFFTR
jgi:hypothetical protein